MFTFFAWVLAFLTLLVQADTEVYDVRPCHGSSSSKDTATESANVGLGWDHGNIRPNMSKVRLESDATVLLMRVDPYDPATDDPDSDPCTTLASSVCPYETRTLFHAQEFCTSSGYDETTKFTVRVSWPASFPVDPDLTIHSPCTRDSSDVGFVLRARNRGRRAPYVALQGLPNQIETVPFIVTVEHLLLGAVPGSMLPLIGFLVAGIAVVWWSAYAVVAPWLLTLADVAEEEARSHMNSKRW